MAAPITERLFCRTLSPITARSTHTTPVLCMRLAHLFMAASTTGEAVALGATRAFGKIAVGATNVALT